MTPFDVEQRDCLMRVTERTYKSMYLEHYQAILLAMSGGRVLYGICGSCDDSEVIKNIRDCQLFSDSLTIHSSNSINGMYRLEFVGNGYIDFFSDEKSNYLCLKGLSYDKVIKF